MAVAGPANYRTAFEPSIDNPHLHRPTMPTCMFLSVADQTHLYSEISVAVIGRDQQGTTTAATTIYFMHTLRAYKLDPNYIDGGGGFSFREHK